LKRCVSAIPFFCFVLGVRPCGCDAPITTPSISTPYLSHFFFLFWFGQVIEENRKQVEEDQALEKRVEGKKAAAKKRATRRSACFIISIIV
jgi:hypothetical protein